MIEILFSLILTIVIELVILWLIKANKKILITSIIINIITNLSLNIFLYYYYFDNITMYWITIIGLELLVFIIEGLTYYLVNKDIRLSFKYSLFANGGSFLIGLIISLIFYFL